MFERFSDRARKVLALANQEAQRFNHEYIGTEHILLGLMKEGTGVGANVLRNLEVDSRKVRIEVEKLLKSGPDTVYRDKLPPTPQAKKVIEFAIEEARNLNHGYVDTEHILLGLFREQGGVAAQVLMNMGLKSEDVREEILNLLGEGKTEALLAEVAETPSASVTIPVPIGQIFRLSPVFLRCLIRASQANTEGELVLDAQRLISVLLNEFSEPVRVPVRSEEKPFIPVPAPTASADGPWNPDI